MLTALDYQLCQQDVHPTTMQLVVRVESGENAHAIGVVGGRLERQPKNEAEAVATVQNLEKLGFNYSVGVSQVNKIHFKRLGWDQRISTAFDACKNLKASAQILKDCYTSALRSGYTAGQSGLEAALSCYYSGSFTRGAQLGYVHKVLHPHVKRQSQTKPLSISSQTSPRSMTVEATFFQP